MRKLAMILAAVLVIELCCPTTVYAQTATYAVEEMADEAQQSVEAVTETEFSQESSEEAAEEMLEETSEEAAEETLEETSEEAAEETSTSNIN